MFKNLQGLSLLHLLWKSTFSARCFWSLGISRHCILTLHRLPKQHKFTFSWLPFETNSLKSSPLVHSLFYIFPITFSAVSSYLSSCYSLPLQNFIRANSDSSQMTLISWKFCGSTKLCICWHSSWVIVHPARSLFFL